MKKGTSYLGILGFLASTHFLIHVFSQLPPVILPILREELGITLTEASFLVSIPLLIQVAFYIPAGIASDRRENLVLAASFVVIAIGALLVSCTISYTYVLIAFALIALGSTLYHPPALKATSEIDDSKKGLLMGIQNAGGSLGYSAGPILLGLILPLWGWRMAFYIWIPFVLLAAAYSNYYLGSRSRHRDTRSYEEKNFDPTMVRSLFTTSFTLVILIGAITDVTFMNLSTYMAIYLNDVHGISADIIGIVFGLGSLVGILGSVLGGAIGDRISNYWAMASVVSLMSTMLAIMPLSENLVVVLALYTSWRGFYSASMPLTSSLVADHSSPENRSLAFGIYSLISNVSGALAVSITSYLVTGSGVSIIFPVSVSMLGPSILLTLLLQKYVSSRMRRTGISKT